LLAAREFQNYASRVKLDGYEYLALKPSTVVAVVERIVADCAPSKILVFGSRARGEARADSDLDLLVLLPAPASDSFALRCHLRELLADLRLSIDILVSDPEHFAEHSSRINSVYHDAAEDGFPIWQDGRLDSFATGKPMKAGTDALLERAASDEATLLLPGIPEIPFGQHVQAAIEKQLKALYNERNEKYPRTHDLKGLARELSQMGENLPPVSIELADLTIYALDLRYEGEGKLPPPLNRKACMETVKIIREYVAERILALNSHQPS
jgi:predicted nucleotidyltransferase/HEPN domain-containing protein